MVRAIGRLYADAFRGLPAPVWRLSIGLFVNRAGTMVLPFLSLYLVRELGFDAGAASTALAAFGLGSVAGSYAGGVIAGRVGTLRVQIWSLVLAGAGFLLVSQVRGFAAVTAAMFLVSAVGDAFRPACITAIVEASTPELRPRAMGLMRLAANAGIAVGPAVGGLLAGIDYGWIFVGEAVTCWAAAAWLSWSMRGEWRSARARRPASTAGAGSLWRDPRFLGLLALVFVLGLVLYQVFSTLPLYLTSDYHLNETQVGLLFAFNAALIVAFEMVLIKLLERRRPEAVMGLGMFLMCAGFGMLPFGSGLAYAALTVAVWTVGEMLSLPFSNVLVAEYAGAGRAATAIGMYSAVFSVDLVLAPLVGLGVLERFGGDVLWTACGLVGVPLWILCAALRVRAQR